MFLIQNPHPPPRAKKEGWSGLELTDTLTLKALGGVPPVRFLLITSEIGSFSTGNFVTFPDVKCRMRTK